MEKSLVEPFLMTKIEVCHIFSPATFLHFLEKLQPATLVTYKRTSPLLFHRKFSKSFQNTPEKQILSRAKLMIFMINNIFCNLDESFVAINKDGILSEMITPSHYHFEVYIWNPNFISRLFAMPQKIKDTWIWLYLSCRQQL